MMTARGSSGGRAGGAVAAAVLCIVSVVLLGRLDGVAAECIHSFEEEGVGFDITKLANSAGPYEYTPPGGSVKYQFNICSDLPSPCFGDACSVEQFTAAGTPLLNLGTQAQASYSLYDTADPGAGVVVVYGGGSTCYLPAQVQASTTFTIKCDETAFTPHTFSYTETQCALAVTFSSAYGCPNVRSGLGAGWVFVILVLVAIAVYLFGGITYKKVTLGTSGVESIPNIDFWRRFFGHVSAGCQRVCPCGRSYQSVEEADNKGDYHQTLPDDEL